MAVFSADGRCVYDCALDPRGSLSHPIRCPAGQYVVRVSALTQTTFPITVR